MLVCVVPALSAVFAARDAAADGFYTPPSPLPPGKAGEVIRAEPMRAYIVPGFEFPARAWRVLYRSSGADGAPLAVSGTVLVPDAPWRGKGARPLVGYAVGGQGVADRCAPSVHLAAGTEYVATDIEALVERGWAVAVTDYPGLGTPGDHPFAIWDAIGASVLDALRAARRLPGAGLSPDGPLALYGYSEGGGAGAAAAELQPSYAPDLPLVGAALGAAPADPLALARFASGLPLGRLAAMWLAIGLAATYPDLPVESLLNDRGRAAFAQFREACILDTAIPLTLLSWSLTPRIQDYFTEDVLERPDWIARLGENRIGALRPDAPVLLQHAPADELSPYAAARALYRDWCALGANVHFRDLPGTEHLTGGFAAQPAALGFLEGRLAGAGVPRAPDCVAGSPRAAAACADSRATLSARRVGPAVLGRTRAQTRRAFPIGSLALRRPADVDRFCLAAGGSIRVAYLRGRAAIILSSSPQTRYRGLRVGSREAAVRRLAPSRRLTVRGDAWHVMRPSRSSLVLVEVRAGRVRQLGLLDRALGPSARRALAMSGL